MRSTPHRPPFRLADPLPATKGETVSRDVVQWLGGTDSRPPMQAELRVAASRSESSRSASAIPASDCSSGLARSSGCNYPSSPGRTPARTLHAASIYRPCASIFCSVRTRSRCCTPHLGCTIDMFFREIERRSDLTLHACIFDDNAHSSGPRCKGTR